MKTINPIRILALALLFTAFGCNKIAQLTSFSVKDHSSTTIKSTTQLNLPFDVTTPDVTTESQNEYEGNNTAKNLVESIYLKELKLTITNPSSQSFNFLKDIEIYINANGKSEQLIASKYSIADDVGTILLLDPTDVNLKEYVSQDSYKLRLRVTTDKIISNDVSIDIDSKFSVKAKLL